MPPAIPEDAALEARVRRLLSRTPGQKVGQPVQADIARITLHDLGHFPLGSVLNGGNSSPGNTVFVPPSEWLALGAWFYEGSLGRASPGRSISTPCTLRAVCGVAKVLGAAFPHNIARDGGRFWIESTPG